MEFVCFTSLKGGVGTSGLVAKLSQKASQIGFKCLAVDLHSKKRTLDIYLGVSDSFVYDINDVCDDLCAFEDALVKVNDNLCFMSCSQSRDIDDYSKVYSYLKQNAQQFDFVFLDVPYDRCDINSKVVLITTCENTSLRCTEKLALDLQNTQKYLIINKIDVDLIVKQLNFNVDDVCDICAVAPIGLVPYDRDYFNGINNDSLCDKAVCNIVKRLDGLHVPAVQFNSKKTIFSRR